MIFKEINESPTHINAKETLFDLIKNHKVTIKDKYNNIYNVFNGTYSNEFLHMESYVISDKSEYKDNNLVLLSGNNKFCEKFISNPYCKFKKQYGAIGYLPCRDCIESNNISEDLLTFYGTPDISYGYNHEHKVWLEIKKSCAVTSLKTWFCYKNNITLLEVNASDIKNNPSIIYVRNILDIRTWEGGIGKVIDNIYSDINKKGYSTEFPLTLSHIPIIYIDEYQKQILQKFNLVLLKHYDENIRNLINPNSNKFYPLIITQDKYNSIFSDYTYDKEYDYNNFNSKMENMIANNVIENGFARYKDYKELYEVKYGVASYDHIKELITDVCNKHNFIITKEYDKTKYPKTYRAILIFDNFKCKPF